MTTQHQTGETRLPSRRRQMARWQRDRRRKRQALAIAAALILVIVAIPAYGYYDTFVEPPRHVVANINGSEFTLGDMVDLTK